MKHRGIEYSNSFFPTKSICLKIAFLFIFFLTGVLPAAYSYLDPGTGSFILQTLIAALFGALFVVKSYWQRIKSWFCRHNPEDNKSTVDSEVTNKQLKSESSEDKGAERFEKHAGRGSESE